MPDTPRPASLDHVAGALGIPPEDLATLALELFGQWVAGRRRFPTLSQQNQEWYRAILKVADKSNPSREELKTWFGLPYGTAQYLAGVFYDPEADLVQEETMATIAARAVQAIEEASKGHGLTGGLVAVFYLSPSQGKSLKALIVKALADKPMEPPTLTSLLGTVKVSFTANQGLDALGVALGKHGESLFAAAKRHGTANG